MSSPDPAPDPATPADPRQELAVLRAEIARLRRREAQILAGLPPPPRPQPRPGWPFRPVDRPADRPLGPH